MNLNPLALFKKKDIPKNQALTTVNTSDDMISMIGRVAMDPNADVEKMKQLLDMQERILDKNAEKEFNSDMVACQSEMGSIKKTSWNDQTKSLYAKLEVITEDIKPIYTSHGFCLCFSHAECPKEDWIRIQCEVSHTAGHSKLYWMDLPPDGHGIKGSVNKTPVHAVASTDSYGKRYITANIFNLAIVGADNDGNSRVAKAMNIDVKQMKELKREIYNADTHASHLLEMGNLGRLEDIPKSRFQAVIGHLKKMPYYQDNRPGYQEINRDHH